MGHGKNEQKNQKVGLGQQPKETREERRRRIEEEAKAREVCLPRLIVKKDGNIVSLNVLRIGGLDLLCASTLRTITHYFCLFVPVSYTQYVLAEN